ncbi:hypothetical protein PAUR_a3041 [Pseudoalteromonas aurantia 208]|uniref:Uncharacterized protein n=1 Tax=Pseudoalteromonas aurantia 208 TaxID=1314867 RepID=A0ABR9EFP4_9GAMM|nr:hypothetical protein [Pseudoalteromonas aurantia 208]
MMMRLIERKARTLLSAVRITSVVATDVITVLFMRLNYLCVKNR